LQQADEFKSSSGDQGGIVMAEAVVISVGSVVNFAGDLTNQTILKAVTDAGWLICDGSSYKQADFPDLFAAIGKAHGGNDTNFNVPALTGRFVRGTNGAASQDPDAANRAAAAPGGATGNAVGSLQLTGTGAPRNPWQLSRDPDHQHSFQHLNDSMHMAWSGSTYSMARWDAQATVSPSGAHSHAVSGGDAKTQPVNVALFALIRAKPGPAAGATPAGAMTAYAAPSAASAPTGYAYCNGMAQAVSASSAALVATIGFNYGGDGVNVFDFPDFRGRFIRGTSHGTPRDPDRASRSASQTGGNAGDMVGSLQAWATGNPQQPFAVVNAGAHTHTCANIPNQYHNAAYGASGPAAYNCMEWTGDWTSTSAAGNHSHSLLGGDAETRPENLYLDWLIALDNLPDTPPIGAVLPFAGDVTSIGNILALQQSGWYPCTGSALRISLPANQALYAIIGKTYGGDSLNFRLPDLRGLFVIGAGGGVAIGTVQAASQTGAPAAAFSTTVAGDHTHTIDKVPPDTHTIDVVMGVELAENNSSASASTSADDHSHAIQSGGDSESRPVNVTADFIIRFA
jgi:microcystin-dependent protein